MLRDVLNLIFESFQDVIKAFDVDIYDYNGLTLSFWEIILGVFTVSIIFGFFLRNRGGSVFGSVENYNEYQNSKRAEAERKSLEAERKAQQDYNNSFLGYAQKRYVKEMYDYEYNRAMGKNALPKHKGGRK